MAIPTFVAAGTVSINDGSSTTVAYPAGWQAGDILLLHVIGSGLQTIPDGWYLVPNTRFTTSGTAENSQVYWRRAQAGDTDPMTLGTASSTDHREAVITAYRGCASQGDPWNQLNTSEQTPASASFSSGSVTTTVNDCLIVCLMYNGLDNVTGARMSSFANTSLTSVTEQVDQWTSTGGGGGLACATGGLASAGSSGTFTATSSSSSVHGYHIIALKPTGTEVPYTYAGPRFIARGAGSSTLGTALTLSLPSGVVENDILIMQIEHGGSLANVPSGWAHVTGSPQTGNVSSNYVTFWKRAIASEPNPSGMTATDHLVGQITAYRGCPTSGDPWHAVASGTDSNSDTTREMGAITTTINDCLILHLVADGSDNVTGQRLWQFLDYAVGTDHAQEASDHWSSDGGGGGVGGYVSELKTAAALAATSTTSDVGNTSYWMTIALKKDDNAQADIVGQFQATWWQISGRI